MLEQCCNRSKQCCNRSKQCCNHSKQCWNNVVTVRNNVATLWCAKNRRCISSRVTLHESTVDTSVFLH